MDMERVRMRNLKKKKTFLAAVTYNPVWRILMVNVFVLSLLPGSIHCMPGPDSPIDIPLAEKIGRIEAGLFPVNGFPPWIRKTITQRMAYHNVPGVSIAVIDDYKLEWVKGYGVMEAGGNRPVTPGTLFQALGISSTVSCLLALNFVERGIIDLDEDVNNKLVSWKIPENEFTAKTRVTLRSLIKYNSAGFNEFGINGYTRGESLPSLRQILEGEEPADSPPIRVIAEPGVFRPGSSGSLFLVSYIVLQQVLEDVSGVPFHELARQFILEPTGMKTSTFKQPLPENRWPMAASGHDRDGRPLKGKWRIYPEAAARGLWTTPSDLAHFALESIKIFNGQSDRIVSRQMVFNMLNPKRSYYELSSNGGGFGCSLVFNYKTGQGIIIMMNSSSYDLSKEIQHSVFTAYRWKWGHFIMHETIFNGMVLVIAIVFMILILPLAALLFFLQRRKKKM
jgi:CubicO group peptidase (beta-lactamase class C family)